MKKIIALPLFILISFLSQAQEATPRVNARQSAQRTRIHEGRSTGELTKQETTLLRAEQRHIRRAERRAKSDGDVSGLERKKLDRKQDRANRHIRRAKHNERQAND